MGRPNRENLVIPQMEMNENNLIGIIRHLQERVKIYILALETIFSILLIIEGEGVNGLTSGSGAYNLPYSTGIKKLFTFLTLLVLGKSRG